MTRKELVQAMEAKWGVKATYLGVPSCDYEITCQMGTFRIDLQGAIKDLAGNEFSAEEILTKTAVEPDTDATSDERDALQIGEYVVELPLSGHTAASLQNLVNMLTSKQHLITRAFELAEPLLGSYVALGLFQRNLADMEAFRTAWAEVDGDCCRGFEVNFEKQTLAFKLVKDNPTQGEMSAFVELVACVNEQAKKLKHASFKPAQEENPKYAMRTWLLRLGMNGDAFKKTRKTLLAKLSGNAAFRTSAEEEKHKARLRVKKDELGEAEGNVC